MTQTYNVEEALGSCSFSKESNYSGCITLNAWPHMKSEMVSITFQHGSKKLQVGPSTVVFLRRGRGMDEWIS